MNKVYIGNLPWTTTEDDLRSDLQEFGEVTDVKIIMDRDTNRSKGFGFVTFSSEEAAQNTVKEIDGSDYQGRRLKASIAEDRPRGNRSGGGYQPRGNNGGYDRNERRTRGGNTGYF